MIQQSFLPNCISIFIELITILHLFMILEVKLLSIETNDMASNYFLKGLQDRFLKC
jgi:hypothetical protein